MKKHLSTIILILVFLAGISLVLYPTVSDYWNGLHQSRAVAVYDEAVGQLDTSKYDEMLAAAQAYNEELRQNPSRFTPTDEEKAWYETLLDVSGTGIMAYIEIPKLSAKLPVYHGTDDAVLQIAVGHVEGSSLPVGGAGTHAVLSGHRGLPSARLLTDLDQMEVGDRFEIHVLGSTLRYEVDQILTVLPYEMDALAIEEDKDYCTLVTCTPYGVNTHRLLVRGHRIKTEQANAAADTAGNAQLEAAEEEEGSFLQHLFSRIPLPVIAAAGAVVILLLLLFSGGRRKNRKMHADGSNQEKAKTGETQAGKAETDLELQQREHAENERSESK